MNQNIRKNRLRLLSSFYEVASRFTEKELVEIRDDASGDAVSKNLASLILASHSVDEPFRQPRSTEVRISLPPRESVSNPKRREAALREILSSKELFSSPSDIARSVPVQTELRPKESREKYVNRILAQFRGLSAQEQLEFTGAIQKKLESRGAGNFVSRWSRLIREL